MLGLALQVLNGRLYASASPAIVADGDAREHQRAGMLRSYATLKKRLRNARAVRNCPGWSTPSQLHRTEPGAVFAEGAQFCQWPDGLEPRNCNCRGKDAAVPRPCLGLSLSFIDLSTLLGLSLAFPCFSTPFCDSPRLRRNTAEGTAHAPRGESGRRRSVAPER